MIFHYSNFDFSQQLSAMIVTDDVDLLYSLLNGISVNDNMRMSGTDVTNYGQYDICQSIDTVMDTELQLNK